MSLIYSLTGRAERRIARSSDVRRLTGDDLGHTVYSMLDVRLADRPNISETAAQAVRRMIVDGRLAAGSRINEVHLAGSLGVSRTPLREALSRLVAEGALVVRPRLGMFVRPFTVEEFEQLYDLRP